MARKQEDRLPAVRRLGPKLGWLLLLLPIVGCAPQAPARPVFTGLAPGAARPAAPAIEVPRQRVGLLLPLSGGNRSLGQAMLNATQLALFAGGDPRVEFLPRDTAGTPAGAAEAARAALADGARVLAGPLTLSETAAAAPAGRAAGAPIFAFTSDAAQAAPGVWVLGLGPSEQGERMADAAIDEGARRLGLLAPADEFGRRLAAGFRARAVAAGLPEPLVVLRPPRGDAAGAARELAAAAGLDGLDAALLGETGDRARAAAAALTAALPRPARLLGSSLWLNDAGLASEPALAGALFPGPDPAARARFEASYQEAFGERPPRLASVAYDAAALAALTTRGAGLPPIGEPLLGADGPIRMLPDGRVQRGLALFAIDPVGEPLLIQPAALPGLAGS